VIGLLRKEFRRCAPASGSETIQCGSDEQVNSRVVIKWQSSTPTSVLRSVSLQRSIGSNVNGGKQGAESVPHDLDTDANQQKRRKSYDYDHSSLSDHPSDSDAIARARSAIRKRCSWILLTTARPFETESSKPSFTGWGRFARDRRGITLSEIVGLRSWFRSQCLVMTRFLTLIRCAAQAPYAVRLRGSP
jgi:hypothetical protein